MLMTFPHKWDGRWLELTTEAMTAEDELLGGLLGSSQPDDHAIPFLDVAELDVSGWYPTTGALEIDVPSYLALDWIPNRTAVVAAQAGVDLSTVTAPSPRRSAAFPAGRDHSRHLRRCSKTWPSCSPTISQRSLRFSRRPRRP